MSWSFDLSKRRPSTNLNGINNGRERPVYRRIRTGRSPEANNENHRNDLPSTGSRSRSKSLLDAGTLRGEPPKFDLGNTDDEVVAVGPTNSESDSYDSKRWKPSFNPPRQTRDESKTKRTELNPGFSELPPLSCARSSIVKRKMMGILDPEGTRSVELDASLTRALKKTATCNPVQKKNKGTARFGAQGIVSWNDFKTAGGSVVNKEVKKVIADLPSDESQGSDTSGHTRYFGNKKVAAGSNVGFVAPSFVKAAIDSVVNGSATTDNKQLSGSGLQSEPSLKNFDENIIRLIESEIMTVTRETGWSEVAGLTGAKKALREIVVLPFKRPDVFKGIRAPPKGVLLFGPPGTGKTMIGRCVASQCKATFFNISASSLTSKWVGEGEKLVRALFAVARVKLPSVVFIDEIDSLLSSRNETEHESSRRIKTEFLVQLDGMGTITDERLLVLGATNRPQELDEAARRRFAKRLYIALPETEARVEIVRSLLKDMDHCVVEDDLKQIGSITNGYSGADMRQLCAEASMGPIRDVENSSTMDIETVEAEQIRPINLQDFVDASKVVRPTVVAEDLQSYSEWDKKFGCLL